ncbi:MAG: type II toxin-antitoxin system HicB family antitoxin [Opitutae bacterium]|nr:type II toxin-antitoxin system HicB family antitoxin [Opitutae bacterium]MCE2452951.1 type II toxin-antitoxin system HicB family antitoxin [Nitrospinota bacterium]
MNMEYTAIIKRRGEWWIGWIEEIPGVNCQERTREELRQSLVETLSEVLEYNRSEALDAAGEDYKEEKVVIV